MNKFSYDFVYEKQQIYIYIFFLTWKQFTSLGVKGGKGEWIIPKALAVVPVAFFSTKQKISTENYGTKSLLNANFSHLHFLGKLFVSPPNPGIVLHHCRHHKSTHHISTSYRCTQPTPWTQGSFPPEEDHRLNCKVHDQPHSKSTKIPLKSGNHQFHRSRTTNII